MVSQSASNNVAKDRPLWKRRWVLPSLMVVGLAVAVTINVILTLRPGTNDAATIRAIVASEELILELTPQLKQLSRSVLNLKLPDHDGGKLFDERVDVIDLQPGSLPESADTFASISLQSRMWSIETAEHPTDKAALDLWRPLLEVVDYFEHAKFYFVSGRFLDDEMLQFEALMGFEGLARNLDKEWISVRAKQTCLWQRREAPDVQAKPSWRIVSWQQKVFQTMGGRRRLFRDVLDQALADEKTRQLARESLHEQRVVRYVRGGGGYPPEPFFTPDSFSQKPGLSVVDVDGDGLDDLYVMPRVGKNQLLRNLGDGTFEDVAAKLRLDFKDHCTCAIFADFDNDGDPDLILGRSLQRSVYLRNEGGHFSDRSDSLVSQPLPYLVTALSAADYNGDGLLDVYFSTYEPRFAARIVRRRRRNSTTADNDALDVPQSNSEGSDDWPKRFLTSGESSEYRDRVNRHKDLLTLVGPPNVLFKNLGGGHFEVAAENDELGVWRDTLQATWADFDNDGDPDLYLSNDWAADHLFRNDAAEKGRRRFVDVTVERGTDALGFGMGAAWGDYDNDGRQDLYVSNMYSKAGRRITAQIQDLGPRVTSMAEGNFLYRNGDEKFEMASGLKSPRLTVAAAGWSWSGQFADFDNDGYLDIYVSSGYFTVPRAVASSIDL